MTVEDLVVDTNVFLHAANPGEQRSEAALAFVRALLTPACATKLCVDPGFHIDRARNQSFIVAEYLEHLRVGSVGYAAVVALATTRRISQISAAVDQGTKKQILQMVRNRRDRTFLMVAINSVEKLFISHDYEDFQKRKRRDIKALFSVAIVEASAVL